MTIAQLLAAPVLSIANELILNLRNDVSGGTAGAYGSKSTLYEHMPYVLEPRDGYTAIVHNFHFISEVRRQLSGVADYSAFSPEEQAHYNNYIDYVDGIEFLGDELLLIEALDFWLTEEVQEKSHPEITRVYEKGVHPWRNLGGANGS